MSVNRIFTIFYAFLVLIASCFTLEIKANTTEFSYQTLPNKINKSERDDRQYQVIQLDNQMKVLLISDEQAVKSLASISLPVGSLHDPRNQQGLAHYTEHMVLMGSQKYPEPSSFSEYLSQHAGRYNASTASHRTAFYFEVENNAFMEALDRLADAIAAPLLDPTYADKERNAVNAELTMARSNDGFRIAQVDAETINQDHPAAQFSGGNLETLSDKPNSILQSELEAFYHRYYSADIMVGVVYSHQPLDELASYAVQTFGRIANRHAEVDDIKPIALPKNTLGKWINMEPAQPKKVLYIQFPFANNLDQFQDKSDEYIGYMLSNRSNNTLFDSLQKQGLIESISVDSDPIRYGNSGIFSLFVSLTDQGLAEKEKVIASLFSYLSLLKNEGIKQKYYDEIADVLTLTFNHPDITRDIAYVEWLSDQMLLYPFEHVLDADYLATNFNPNAIKTMLSSLTIDNARIWVIAPNQATDKMAYFVQAPYKIEDITAQQRDEIMAEAEKYQFSLPLENPYIANDFTIFPQEEESKDSNAVFNSSGQHVHFVSHYFADEPKAAIILSLRNNKAYQTAQDQVMFQLLDYLASRKLAPLHFQSSVAGVNFSSEMDSGLSITISGFNQHLDSMLLNVLATYRSVDIHQDVLEQAKSWYLERLDAADHANSYQLALQPVNALSQLPYFERNVRRDALSSIDVKQLRQYRDELLFNSVPYMMSLGNITKTQSLALYQQIKQKLSGTARYQPEYIAVNHPFDALISQQAGSTDNALFVGFVSPNDNKIASQVTSYLLYKMISPWFYDQLRTSEQLGYAVFSLPIYLGESAGIGFLIQSNQYDPAYLNERYQNFYPSLLTKLNELTESEFQRYKQSMMNELLMAPQKLYEEFSSHLSDYYQSNFSFDSKQKKITYLKTLSRDQVIDFYEQTVMKHNRLYIISQVLGDQKDNSVSGVLQANEFSGAEALQKLLLASETDD